MNVSKHNFKKYFILLMVFTVVSVSLIIALFYLPIRDDLRMPIAMILVLIFMVGLLRFKPRLMYHLEELQFYRLVEKQGPKIKSSYSPESDHFLKNLAEHNYIAFFKTEDFTLYSYHVRDKSTVVLRKPMLHIIAVIHNHDISFQSKEIVEEINKHEDYLYKQKKKIFNYTVIILKEGPLLDKKEQKDCDYITYSKKGSRSIVTVNAYYETKLKSYYLLYSNDYSPNLYYTYAITQLKSLIS